MRLVCLGSVLRVWGSLLFAMGTLVVAFLNLPDIFRPQKVFFAGAVGASLSTLSLLLFEPVGIVIATQFSLGFFLASVYPVAMQMVTGCYREGRGLAWGVVSGARAGGIACRRASRPKRRACGCNVGPTNVEVKLPYWSTCTAARVP